MNVLITGATGFIGNSLVEFLLNKENNIIVLARNKNKVKANVRAVENISEISENESIDIIINLAGAPIAKKWTKLYKQELIDSRIGTTRNIATLVKKLKQKPQVLLSASAIGYYGSQLSNIIDETSKPNNEFTHQLCKEWESEALQLEKLGLRVCITRLGVVLGKNGGALQQMLTPFKIGLGGKIGSGNQYFSWIHISDVLKAFYVMMNDAKYNGIYNLTSPNPITNIAFTHALGQQLKRPTIFPMPEFVISLLFGEMGRTLLLKGSRVIPKRLIESGFSFQYPDINTALQEILK
jgi:uncharacterized protein (TIGR01777 family)